MKKNIALVLSGGAARGIAHIGVIEELEEQGFYISSIAGNSMGALVGAIYAMGKMKEFKEWLINLNKTDIFSMIDFSFRGQGLIKGDKIFRKIKPFFEDKRIEELSIPFTAVAADIENMKEKVFSSGFVHQAVRASISIPTVFTPVELANSVLVDGGIVNPIPINRIVRTKNDFLIAVHVNANIKLSFEEEEIITSDTNHINKVRDFEKKISRILNKKKKQKLNYFKILNKSASLLTQTLSEKIIEKNKPDLLIQISQNTAGYFDFFKAQKLIDIGRFETRKALLMNKKS